MLFFGGALKPEERKEERISNNKKYNIDESNTVFKVWSSGNDIHL